MQFKTESASNYKLKLLLLMAALALFSADKTIYAADARLNIIESERGNTLSVSRSGLFEADSLVPGDTVYGRLTVSNKTGRTAYYRLRGIYGQSEQSILMDKAELTITNKDKQILYKGSFGKAYTPELIIDKSGTEDYSYSLHIPVSCGNELINESNTVRFVYIFSDRENGTLTESGESGNGGDNEGLVKPDGGEHSGGGSGSGHAGGNQEIQGQGQGSKPGGSSGGTSGGSSSGNISGGRPGGSSGNRPGGSSGSRPGSSGSGSSVGKGYLSYGGGTGSSGGISADKSMADDSVYAVPDFNLKQSGYEGSWINQDGKWYFKTKSGEAIKNGWALLFNPYAKPEPVNSWYYFDTDGVMQIGWIKCENDSWYYTHEISDGNLGNIVTGWVDNKDDGKTYYLSELNGRMLTGWNRLKGRDGQEASFYFAKLEDTYRQNWFFNTAFGRWVYKSLGGRTYGSMYRSELTPDRQKVDSNGAKIERQIR